MRRGRSTIPFTAEQVNALIAQPKVIREMPALVERNGFARYQAKVLVGLGLDIGLILEVHVGLNSTVVSPNGTLRWMNQRIRGVDESQLHDSILGMPPVEGWHEHLWNNEYGDAEIRAIAVPPQGLRAFFRHLAQMWNIRIEVDKEPSFDDR